MKKILIVLGIVGSLVLIGCGASNTNAQENSIFTYLGSTNDNELGAKVYRYEDKDMGKVIYITNYNYGTGIAVVNK